MKIKIPMPNINDPLEWFEHCYNIIEQYYIQIIGGSILFIVIIFFAIK